MLQAIFLSRAKIKKMTQTPNIIKGSLFALLAFFCMAIFGIFTKMALQRDSYIWVSFFTYLSGSLLLIPLFARKGFGYLNSNHYLFLLGRATFGTLASLFYTISIQYIPIVNGTLLFNTAPIFIPILAILFIRAKIEKSTWIAVVLGFIGILIVIKPTAAIFTQTGNLIALLSGIFLAIAYFLMKLLSKSDPGVRITFYYLGIGSLIQIPLLFYHSHLPEPTTIIYATLCGLTLVLAQLSLIKGYNYADASEIGVYQYSTVVFIGLFSWKLWGEVPSLREFIGMLIVALAGIIIIRSNNHKKILKA